MPENKDIERWKPDEIERRTDSLVQRSLDYLKEFEEQGLANVEESDLEGWDLHRAAEENRVDIARALIARGDDVNEESPYDYGDEDEYYEGFGNRPLRDAALVNSLEVARLLIEHGADIEAKADLGHTALYFAVVK